MDAVPPGSFSALILPADVKGVDSALSLDVVLYQKLYSRFSVWFRCRSQISCGCVSGEKSESRACIVH